MPSVRGPLQGLVNDISGSVSNLIGDITGSNSLDVNVPSMPTAGVQGIMSTLRQDNWNRLVFPYTFSVTDIVTRQPGGGFSDFALPLAPTSIEQTEEFAIKIVPTQGGTTTTHSGNRYKTLRIEGTTGIAPFRGSGGVARSTGEAIFQPNELKYRSGYEVFIRLRNWFKAYYEHKKIAGEDARNLRLIFKNYKDGEFLIVELRNFEMKRQAGRPHLYDYSLDFRVLSHFTFQPLEQSDGLIARFDSALSDANDLIQGARGVFLRSQGILRQIEATAEAVVLEPLRQISLAVKALQNIPATAADIGNRIISNTVTESRAAQIALGVQSQIEEAETEGGLDPRLESVELPSDIPSAVATQGSAFLSTLGEGLLTIDAGEFSGATIAALEEEQALAQQSPRSFYTETISELRRVRENAEDLFNLGDPAFDSLFNRVATLSADPTKVITDEELEVLKAFNDAITGVRLLLSAEALFRSSFDERIADIIERFSDNIALVANPAVREMRLPANMPLERLAQQELGDSTRWGEIAEVNNLEPPYIINDPSIEATNVLRPGDVVLIPTPLRNGFSAAAESIETTVTENLNPVERSLGTDFMITPDFDLSLTPSGDLELVAGPDNMAQAVVLKLSYEPGEVMAFPQLGAGIVPGQKFPALQDIQDGVTNTLLQDTRVESIDELSIRRDGTALFLTFNLKIKRIDIPVPISIRI